MRAGNPSARARCCVDDYFRQTAAPVYPPPPAPTPWAQPAGGYSADGYPPPVWGQPGYPAPPTGTSTGVKVLVGVAIVLGTFVVIGILAAIAIPVFLNQRNVVSTPPVVLGFPRMTDAASRAEADRFLAMPTPGRKVAASYGRDSQPVVLVGAASHRMAQGEAQDLPGRRAQLHAVRGLPPLHRCGPRGARRRDALRRYDDRTRSRDAVSVCRPAGVWRHHGVRHRWPGSRRSGPERGRTALTVAARATTLTCRG